MATVTFTRVLPQRIAMFGRGRGASPPLGGGGSFRGLHSFRDGSRRLEETMSGMTVPVIGMTPFNFTGVAANSGASVILAQNIDVTAFTEATVLVRVHAIGITAASQAEIAVSVYGVLPSPQDPATYFRTSSALATVTLDDGNAAGDLVVGTISAPLGAFLTITVGGTMSSPVAASLTATLSVDLSLKSS